MCNMFHIYSSIFTKYVYYIHVAIASILHVHALTHKCKCAYVLVCDATVPHI